MVNAHHVPPSAAAAIPTPKTLVRAEAAKIDAGEATSSREFWTPRIDPRASSGIVSSILQPSSAENGPEKKPSIAAPDRRIRSLEERT